jgi:hypothetical protein
VFGLIVGELTRPIGKVDKFGFRDTSGISVIAENICEPFLRIDTAEVRWV